MNERIGDYFPQNFQKQFNEACLVRGAVIVKWDPNSHKDKIFVLFGMNTDQNIYAFLRINSKINPNIYRNDTMKNEHHLIEFNDETACFLSHNSYVNCSEFAEFYCNEINKLIKNKPDSYKGKMPGMYMDQIMHKVINSDILVNRLKKKYQCTLL